MSCWCSLETRQHWITALEFYFGKELAKRSGDVATPVGTKTLLDTFLGRKAADALTHRITSAPV
jgi:L,D-peptidoglycan transpeptidase YkuD (ErfK/YbiS/YcfS/YnhG family)